MIRINTIKPNVTIITEPDILKRIEIAGRTCYKSEDKITDDSSKRFYNALVKRGHTSVLEHSNLILRADNLYTHDALCKVLTAYNKLSDIPHYIRNTDEGGEQFIFSGNLRAWRNLVAAFLDNALMISLFANHDLFSDMYNVNDVAHYDDILKASGLSASFVDSAEHKMHNIITSKFVCSRAMSHELVRHRIMGISQESQRYVKYGELDVIEPSWLWDASKPNHEVVHTVFLSSNLSAEHNYKVYIDQGFPPQLARGALTNDTKTEVVMTGTVLAWERFLALRDSSAAHPDIQLLARMFKDACAECDDTRRWNLE